MQPVVLIIDISNDAGFDLDLGHYQGQPCERLYRHPNSVSSPLYKGLTQDVIVRC